MADDNVKIHVEFPTYATLPDDQKSLVNFLMDNGSVYFRGEYDTNGDLLHMSGSVGLNYQSSTLNPLILYTPDQPVDETNPFSLTHLPDRGASIPTVYDEQYDYSESEEQLHYEGGIIDCNTVLCECDTSLKIYTIGQNTPSEDDMPIAEPRSIENTRRSSEVRVAADTGMINIPVKMWATVNGEINKDRTLLPTFIETKGDNGNGITIMKAAFHRNESASVSRDYSFQLRTSNFKVKDTATGTEHDMFYKIGIVAPSTYTVDEVKQQILDYGCKVSLWCDNAVRQVEGGYKLLGSTYFRLYPYLVMSGAPSMDINASDPSAVNNVFSTESSSYNNTSPTAFIGGIVVLNPENQDYPVPGGDELSSVNPGPTRSATSLRNVESGDFYTFIYYKLYENVDGQSEAVEVNEEDIPEDFFLLTEETGDYNLFASGPLTDTYLTLNVVDSNINGGHVAISEAREVTNRVYYFSPEGPSATTGTYLNQNTSYPIYNEDGTIASYPSYNSFTPSLAYIYKIAPSEEYVIGECMYVNTNNGYCWNNVSGNFYIYPNSSGGNGPYPDAWCIHCTTAVTRTTLYP